MRPSTFLRISTFGALLLGCADPSASIEIAKGNVLASSGRWEEAAQAYRRAAQRSPSSAHPFELLGHLLHDHGDPANAREAYLQAIAVDPNRATEARIGLARLAEERGDLTDAIAELGRLLDREPHNVYALLSRASLSLKRGGRSDLTSALEDSERALAVDPRSPPARYLKANALLQAGKTDLAAAIFAELKDTRQGSALGWYGEARIAGLRGEKAAMVSKLSRARAESASLEGAEQDRAFIAFRRDPDFQRVIGKP